MNLRIRTTVLFALVGFAATSAAAEGASVADPHYGEALFYFYQQDYPHAIAKLLAADLQGRLPNHDAEAELLLGGMYLSYGLNNTAGEIFARLLSTEPSPRVRDRVWFYLAQSYYRRGNLPRAADALAKIEERLDKQLESERQMLAVQIMMTSGEYQAAATALTQWRAGGSWVPYARYNLGVALARLGDLEAAARELDSVGKLRGDGGELTGLRDKANLALGFAFIQAQQNERAIKPLERVRLDGPFSSKALLGLGWAQTASGHYRRALVPWQALQTRDLLDPAVQESWLAAPFAYRKLGALGQAAGGFEQAVTAYADEIDRIDDVSAAIREGHLLTRIVALKKPGAGVDFGRAPEGHYLAALYADHIFQAGLKNYTDLLAAHRNVVEWQERAATFKDMLENGERAYAERLPTIIDAQRPGALSEKTARYSTLADKLTTARDNNDAVAFATTDELAALASLDEIEARIRVLPTGASRATLDAKRRLLSGAIHWRLEKDYFTRARAAEKRLKELDQQLVTAGEREAALRQAFDDAPARFAGFGQRIQTLDPRMQSLAERLSALAAGQDQALAERALVVLNDQRTRLQSYLAEAQFGLAAIYDRAVAESEP